ncbi:protein-tyrosine-phosphatase [Paenibacillus sp. CCS19]|uniref:tyrosine-protein phosphatase n=1 Tax=Paenibacillus sp. CCS19 TaxID=3158387 RepID=UPI00256B629B|nr:tyrosine-protein phosphatase [Paenibacillus cellulosilyticus]GMK38655.1 protein-tyrosine-phosphatase [Paenibacillus cellulosilyticus]
MTSVAVQVNRSIRKMESLINFRDIGGLPTADGRLTRTGIMYRSNEPHKLKLKDLDKFNGLDLKLICDLRTPNERKARLPRFVESGKTMTVNVPFYQNDEDYTRFQIYRQIMSQIRTVDFHQFMRDFYRKVLFESTNQIRDVMTLLAEQGSAPMLIHCASGKDRTGIIAAIVQLVTGVPRREVVSDYLLSNPLNKSETDRAIRMLRFLSGFRISRERLLPLLEVRSEYLEEVLDELFARYGSIDAYLMQACQVEEQTIRVLRERFV